MVLADGSMWEVGDSGSVTVTAQTRKEMGILRINGRDAAAFHLD